MLHRWFRPSGRGVVLGVGIIGLLGAAVTGAAQAPTVKVSLPVQREAADFADFAGRLAAVETVEVRARATGYLDKVHFKEGSEVKKGDLLFEIDPRPYQARLKQAQVELDRARGRLALAEAEHRRARDLFARKAISREDFDKIAGERIVAEGAVAAARAALEVAQLNLDFTKVRSPIDGRISRRSVDPGNVVKADETALTTIVSTDPVYVYFDVDERTLLRMRRALGERKQDNVKIPIRLQLADEKDFPHKGVVDFVDNQVDANTGAIRMRGVFANPKRLFLPGMFVRVRVALGPPRKVLEVPEGAVLRRKDARFVLVVNDKNVVEERTVTTGQSDRGMRIIETGLRPDERVVVAGQQRVRPGETVEPAPMKLPAPDR
jgi:RND family efflux transporter MFP subunit